MRWLARRSGMVQRTCLECGETWTLEAGVARLKVRTRGRLPVQGAGGRLDVTPNLSRDQLDQQLETVREARTCPKCGSEHYQDRPA
jgi:hypothetical protein